MNIEPLPGTDDRLYTRHFFQVLGAVILFMTGVSLQFHFGEYVEYLGHDVGTLGWVLGISVLGQLLIRLHIGRWIDRFGCRAAWAAGAVIVAIAVGTIQFVQPLWLLVLLRALGNMATALVMTTVAVFAALIAPPKRSAESLGILGLGGFLGMILGATLGDYIFDGPVSSVAPFRVFFTGSAVCALAAGAIILLIKLPASCRSGAARGIDGAALRLSPGDIVQLVLHHWPGMILLVGFAFTMVFCLQTTFLERLAEARGFMNIKVFFLTYGPTAIVLRLLCRRVPERLGRTRTVVGGMILHGIGVLSLVGIDSQWRLIVPGILLGAGHSFIFPSMVDLAAERLPREHRGMGTSVILGAGDVGLLTGLVVLGQVIDQVGYDAALGVLAAVLLVSAVLFAISRREHIVRRAARQAQVTE